MASRLEALSSDISRLQGEGRSIRAIADELGIPRTTLSDYINSVQYSIDELSDVDTDHEEIPVFIRDYTHLDKLHMYPLGDLHIGSPAHAEKVWLEWLSYLESNKDTSLLNTGDNLDSAIKTSKSETYDATMTVGQAKRKFQNQLKKLAEENRVDAITRGNHENRIYRAVGDCPMLDVADNLGVNYVDSACVIVYLVGNQEYEVFMRHGTGMGNGMIGSRANQLQKQAHVVNADVYVSGHTHSQLVSSDNVFVREGERMIRKRRLYVSSGSFCNYENYASERGYVPGRLGAPRIFFDGTHKDCHVSI